MYNIGLSMSKKHVANSIFITITIIKESFNFLCDMRSVMNVLSISWTVILDFLKGLIPIMYL